MSGTDPVVEILKLAAQETVSAGYPEITPGHLLIALSRATEDESDAVGPSAKAAIQAEFEHLGIVPKRFRRRLRALLGHANAPLPEEPLHRSQACKAVFAAAEQDAAAANEPLDPQHLVRAAFMALSGVSRADGAQPSPEHPVEPVDDIPNEL